MKEEQKPLTIHLKVDDPPPELVALYKSIPQGYKQLWLTSLMLREIPICQRDIKGYLTKIVMEHQHDS